MGKKPLRIWLDKIDGFIKIDDEIRYLVLLRYNEIYDRIKYLISKKKELQIVLITFFQESELTHIILYSNIIMLFKSVVNENKNHYFYNIFLEGSYKIKSNTQYF